MAVGERRPLAEARRVAEGFARALEPSCERIEVAGSIRRCREDVGDIEIVCVPKHRQEEGLKTDLFRPPSILEVNCVWEAIEGMGPEVCRPLKIGEPGAGGPDTLWHRKRLKDASRYFKLFLPRSGFRVDLFMATPETWGYTFTVRTGSADFGRAMVTHHGRKGGRFEACRVYSRTGELLDTPEERDMFEACGVKYIAPPLRLDASSLEPIR